MEKIKMKLSKEIKNKIKQEYKEFEKSMYAGKTKEERDELGQFFTPPAVSIKLIETFEAETLADKVILDPTCGSGNLLAACLIAGADLDKIFGNDFDYTMVKICRERLNKICTDLNKPLINN
jgi:type I restriction-modification system DNA methylase subunit